jgi:hypothetical protein
MGSAAWQGHGEKRKNSRKIHEALFRRGVIVFYISLLA